MDRLRARLDPERGFVRFRRDFTFGEGQEMVWQFRVDHIVGSLVFAVGIGALGPLLFSGGVVVGARPAEAAEGDEKFAPLPDFADVLRVRRNKAERAEKQKLSEAVREARESQQLQEYQRRRAKSQMTTKDQYALARWCRENKLVEQARLHWRILLSLSPNHPEAIKRLMLREYRGMLLSADQVARIKSYDKEIKAASRQWAPDLKRMRRAIKLGSAKEKDEAIKKLQSIDKLVLVPTLIKMFANEGVEANQAIVRALHKMPGQMATSWLTRVAVRSPHREVRMQAADALEDRPRDDVIPPLVAHLNAPIEMAGEVNVQTVPLSMVSGDRILGQGPDNSFVVIDPCSGDSLALEPYRMVHRVGFSYEIRREGRASDTTYRFEGGDSAEENGGYAGVDGREAVLQRVRSRVARVRGKVDARNAEAEKLNLRIHETLVRVTGMNSDSDAFADKEGEGVHPSFWWKWWEQNSGLNNYLAKGTEVWTETGLVPIEEIRLGDQVLGREDESGEFTFNTVVGVDKKQQETLRRLEFKSRTLVTTPEQQIFVAGVGWRRADEIRAGAKLLGLDEPELVDEDGAGTAAEVHALIIDGVPNFFVDRQGILVHDATRPESEEDEPPKE